ncbi:hypothetical protein [Fulvivirga sp.]|uniref:tetratricopeptide repeat protein n=1 Tax=Fulvivirga sp. TaxID=1931237 RepID=UPI0032ED5D99
MTPKEQIELFDNFINGNLSGDEKLAFENRLNNDLKLKEEFDEYRLIIAGIVEHGAKGLKEKLKEREEYYRRSRTNAKMYYKIAAAILLVMVSTFLILKYAYSPNLASLYLKYYEPYPNIVDPLDRTGNSEVLSAYQLYELGKYNETIEKLSAIPDNIIKPSSLFYLGQAYMATSELEKALDCFQKIEDSSNYYQIAQWHIALTFLKLNDVEQVEKQLETIIEQKGDYQKQALALKEEL